MYKEETNLIQIYTIYRLNNKFEPIEVLFEKEYSETSEVKIIKSLIPYEGVSCRVKCFDELSIKDLMIFDNKAYYHVDKSM